MLTLTNDLFSKKIKKERQSIQENVNEGDMLYASTKVKKEISVMLWSSSVIIEGTCRTRDFQDNVQ